MAATNNPNLQEPADDVQEGIGRVQKYPNGQTRDWSLYVFFRVLSRSEMAAYQEQMAAMLKENSGRKGQAASKEQAGGEFMDLLENAERFAQIASVSSGNSDSPSNEFRAWLRMLRGEKESLATIQKDHETVLAKLKAKPPKTKAAANSAPESGVEDFKDPLGVLELLREINLENLHNKEPGKSSAGLLDSALPDLLAFNTLKALEEGSAKYLLPEGGSAKAKKSRKGDLFFPAATNLAFNFHGLSALGINKQTLESFPDVFKQGMAARHHRLGDVGPNAPEHWSTPIGLSSIHGYFTFSLPFQNRTSKDNSEFWEHLRQDVDAFNRHKGTSGRNLRILINLLYRIHGMEIQHLELGENPYPADGADGDDERNRREHFGFRDGISQPFVDLNLADPPAGGGTPGVDGSWEKIAPGEIFLDRADEDGAVASQPWNNQLKKGATYLVFRKLRQDVEGFRSFMNRMHPGDKNAADKLAAKMMGRWQNGQSLIHAPHEPTNPGGPDEINNFLFAADDPKGEKCPLGSHIRRCNPRDIGGNDDVRRHRILRRSISYGGPMLPEDGQNDGRERGLLFVAANARIDLQFEVIQGDWINGGEFQGQAGLARCPVTGSNNEQVQDSFISADSPLPLTRLPSFVKTEGGDYFFAPGVETIRQIAEGEEFAPDAVERPPLASAHAQGNYKTPDLFDPGFLKGIGAEIIGSQKRVKFVRLPGTDEHVAFIAQHADVKNLLSNAAVGTGAKGKGCPFSVEHYTEAGKEVLDGGDLLIGTQLGTSSEPKRKVMQKVLDRAWGNLAGGGNPEAAIRRIVEYQCDAALRGFQSTRRIDLVQDLGISATYGVLAKVFGIEGPDWITELAVALPFAKRRFGEVQPDWLAALKGETGRKPGAVTLLVWSVLLSSRIVGNVRDMDILDDLGRQAGAEMRQYLAKTLREVRTRHVAVPQTLVESFVVNESVFVGNDSNTPYNDWRDYHRDVVAILLEIVGTTIASTPYAFANIMKTVLDNNIKLHAFADRFANTPQLLTAFTYECERFNPTIPLFMRRCEEDQVFDNQKIEAGTWVIALTRAANLDFRKVLMQVGGDVAVAVANISQFRLDRKTEDYLMFGAHGTDRECWGRDYVALPILEELVRATARLRGLARVAGPKGEPERLLLPIIGLTARFEDVAPALKPKQPVP